MAVSRSSKLDKSGLDTFVGREAETRRLDTAIHDTVGGVGKLVLIEGEAGKGKTHLLMEASKTARDAGMLVLWGRCYDNQATPTYQPWAEVLHSCLQEIGHNREEAAKGLPLVSAIVPETGFSPSSEDQTEHNFTLIDAIVLLLMRVARACPIPANPYDSVS